MDADEIEYRLSRITMAHERALNEAIRVWHNTKGSVSHGLSEEARLVEEAQEAIVALVAENGYKPHP